MPAFFTLWIRRYVHEPETWTKRPKSTDGRSPFAVIFGSSLIKRTLLIIALGSAVQFANWGLFFWLPAFLARPVAQGAGMRRRIAAVDHPGTARCLRRLPHVRIHRRPDRAAAGVCALHGRAALLVPIYGQMARSPFVLLALGPLIGYFGYGYFSMFGGFVAELYPAAVRATGQGTSYNIGRMAGAIAPTRSA